MVCAKCGASLEEGTEVCPACTPRGYVLNAESGEFRIEGFPIGTVVEGSPDNPDGRQVDSRHASGGRSVSRTDAEGAFQADLSVPLDRGRDNEPRVMKVLAQALSEKGRDVDLVNGARDEDGQDGLLKIDGNRVEVQITLMPQDSQLWHELNTQRSSSRSGDQIAAVIWVRGALENKAESARGMLLALNASHFGAMVGPKLVDAYISMHGNPVDEFEFKDVWIIGPTVQSSARLKPTV